MRKGWIALGVCVCLVGLSGGAAFGGPLLNLDTMKQLPDVMSGGITVSYDGGTHHLTASGTTLTILRVAGNQEDLLTLGDFSLDVLIDPSTGNAISGTLLLTGDARSSGTPGPAVNLFQSARLVAFGSGTEDKFEFKFLQDGGSLAAPGTQIGVVLDGREITAFHTPVFSGSSWSNDGNGLSDTFLVPEPATLVLLAAGGLVLTRRRAGRK